MSGPDADIDYDPGAEPITRGEFLAFKKAVIKRLKFLDGLISDAFQAISDLESKENELVDEAVDRATRAERAVRRLKKEFDSHDHEED